MLIKVYDRREIVTIYIHLFDFLLCSDMMD